MVLLAQPLDEGTGGVLFRLALRTAWRGEEKLGLGVSAELVAEHPEGAFGVAELGGDLLGGALIEEVAA